MTALGQINRGTQQQAAATQQTSAALGQIEKSAKRAQQNAIQANERVARMADDLKQSSGTVDKLVAGVSTGLDNTRASLETIARLEAVGRNIEKIVSGISLVVVQTTMLAVSGSVEAARAGEAGRGFAVVSNDIRSLAREASDSADRIKETVGGILEQIASLRRDLEQIVDSVEVEVQNNRSVIGALDKVERDVAALRQPPTTPSSQGAEQILSAAVEIGDGRAPDRGRRRGGEQRRPPGLDGIDRAGAAAPRTSPPPSRKSLRWPTRSSSRMAERFLTFRANGELYALPANQVAEVIRLPAVARVPQAPKGLLGLANLRGSVLPVASLRGLLGRRGVGRGHDAGDRPRRRGAGGAGRRCRRGAGHRRGRSDRDAPGRAGGPAGRAAEGRLRRRRQEGHRQDPRHRAR